MTVKGIKLSIFTPVKRKCACDFVTDCDGYGKVKCLRTNDEMFAKNIFGEYRHFMKKFWGTYGVPAQ